MAEFSSSVVAVIIVNWNSWAASLDCLNSLRTTVGASWHLFIVDNASSDASRTHFVDIGEDVTVIASAVNGGWTGGNNLGVEAALAAGYEKLFILNNDAQVKPNTIAVLIASGAGIRPEPVLGPIHRDEYGELDFVGSGVDSKTGMPTLPDASKIDVVSLPAIYPAAYVRGAGLFVARAHFEALGMFDDDFYLNYDETDWCFRARSAGFPVQMVRDAEIIHTCSGSIGGISSPLNTYFIVRNGLLFAEKHCSKSQRSRHFVRMLRELSETGEGLTRLRRMKGVVFGGGRRMKAARTGLRDYLLRRFGDCPSRIRTLSSLR